MEGKDFKYVTLPSMNLFKISFLRRLDPVIYITPITHKRWDIFGKCHRIRTCKAKVILVYLSSDVYSTVRHCHEAAQNNPEKETDAHYNYLRHVVSYYLLHWTF